LIDVTEVDFCLFAAAWPYFRRFWTMDGPDAVRLTFLNLLRSAIFHESCKQHFYIRTNCSTRLVQ